MSGHKHPFYGDYELDENHQTNFLEGFNPNNLPKLVSKNPQAFANALKPSDRAIPYNSEQIIKGNNFKIENDYYGALNMNADLGLQYTIENMLYPDILTQKDDHGQEKPTFVIVSSGHALAGLASIAKLTVQKSDGNKTCLFDTSVYMPLGTWRNSSRLNVATQGAAIWAQTIANAKKKCSSYGGGVAIALNGHRGDVDFENIDKRAANIDAQKVFGPVEEFVKRLNKRRINRVVVITETHVDNPSKVNKFPLEILKEDESTFSDANKDLYDFLKEIQKKGVEVIVVSGEQRVNKCGRQIPIRPNRLAEPVSATK
ncbi:MAG: hypothetical protein ACXVCP_02360 [Bdellovibrio sp.]